MRYLQHFVFRRHLLRRCCTKYLIDLLYLRPHHRDRYNRLTLRRRHPQQQVWILMKLMFEYHLRHRHQLHLQFVWWHPLNLPLRHSIHQETLFPQFV